MANINIRIDDALKQQADAVLTELGMNMTTATTVFLKQLVRHNGIPFEIKADPFFSPENQSRLLAAAGAWTRAAARPMSWRTHEENMG